MKKIVDVDPLDRTFSPDMLKGKGVRGKYLSQVTKSSNLVRLSPEVAKIFPTDADVNNALRLLAELSKSLPDLGKKSKHAARKRVAA